MRHSFKVPAACAAFAVAGLVASNASAVVINIDMSDFGYPSHPTYSGIGVAPDAPTNILWNVAVNGGTTAALLDSTGAATSVTFTTDAMNTYDNSRPNDLMNTYLYTGIYNPKGFSIDGLAPSTAYDLYIYSAPNNTHSTFTFGAQSITLGGTEASSATFVPSDWGMLTVTSSGTGTISGVLSAGGSGNYTAFNGMQIVGVPEPTSLGLLSLAGLALLRRRK